MHLQSFCNFQLLRFCRFLNVTSLSTAQVMLNLIVLEGVEIPSLAICEGFPSLRARIMLNSFYAHFLLHIYLTTTVFLHSEGKPSKYLVMLFTPFLDCAVYLYMVPYVSPLVLHFYCKEPQGCCHRLCNSSEVKM